MKKRLLALLLFTLAGFYAKGQWLALTDSHLEGLTLGLHGSMLKSGGFLFTATQAGIYRSDLTGNNWTLKSTGISTATGGDLEIIALTANPAGLYAATTTEILKSTNNGDTWTLASTGIPASGELESTLLTFQNELYTIVTDDGVTKVFTSTNDAGLWSPIYIFTEYEGAAIVTPTAIYLKDDGDLIKTTDGINFLPLGSSLVTTDLENLSGDDTYLFGSLGLTEIYRLELATGTWSLKTSGIPAGFGALTMANANGTLFTTAIDLADMNHFELYRSTDNANTWTKVNATGLSLPYLFEIVPATGGLLGLAMDALYLSTDNGNTWAKSSTGLNARAQALYVSGNTLLAASPLSKLLKSTDNGNTFGYAETGLQAGLLPWNLLNAGPALVGEFSSLSGDLTLLYQSLDNGLTWTLLTLPSGVTDFSLIGTAGADLYIASGALVYHTLNNGLNWNVVAGLSNDLTILGNAQKLFGYGWDNGLQECVLLESTDGGANWLALETGLDMTKPVDNLLLAGTNVLLLQNNKVLLRTTNTWTLTTMNGLPAGAELLTLNYNLNRIYLGTNMGVFYSLDLGANWLPLNNAGIPPAVKIFSLAFLGDKIFAGTEHNGIYETTNPFAGIEAVNADKKEVNIFPNPSSDPVISLDYALNENSDVNISVYDMQGKEVIAVAGGKQTAGQQQMPVDISGLGAGVYQLVLRTENSVSTQKVVIAR